MATKGKGPGVKPGSKGGTAGGKPHIDPWGIHTSSGVKATNTRNVGPGGAGTITRPGGSSGTAAGGPLAGLDPGLKDGIKTPPVDPFLTPEQLGALSSAIRDYNIQTEDLRYNLGVQASDTVYQKEQSDKNAVAATSNANDEAIRRGIFQSSIRDGDLQDIQGMNASAKARFDDLFTAAKIHTQTQQDNLNGAMASLQDSFDKMAVANAQDAGKDQNPYLLDPQKPAAAKPPKGADTPKDPFAPSNSYGGASVATASGSLSGKESNSYGSTKAGPGKTPGTVSGGGVASGGQGTLGKQAAAAYAAKPPAAGKVRAWTPLRAAARHR